MAWGALSCNSRSSAGVSRLWRNGTRSTRLISSSRDFPWQTASRSSENTLSSKVGQSSSGIARLNEFDASEPDFGGRILQKEVGRLFPKRVGQVRAGKAPRCTLRDVFPKEEVVIPELVGCEDAASWLVVASRLFATNVIGKEFFEPFQVDGACQIDSCLEHAGPAKVACVECHEQVCVGDDGFGGEADAAASDHHAGSLQAATFDHTIGVGEQNPLEQIVVGVNFAGRLLGLLSAISGDQIVAQPRDLAGRERVDAAIAKGGCEVGPLGFGQQVEPGEDVRSRAGSTWF